MKPFTALAVALVITLAPAPLPWRGKPFQCEFDHKGNFLHLKSLVDEGVL